MRKTTVTIPLNEKILDVLDLFKNQQLSLYRRLAEEESKPALKKVWLTRVKAFEAADYEFLAEEYLFDCAVEELKERGELDG